MKKVYRITESELINIMKKSLICEDNSEKNITNIQKALKSKGYKYASLLGTSGPNRDGVDGIFGDKTKRAILAFQKDNGLEPVGYVGPKTARLLGVNQMDKSVLTLSNVSKLKNKNVSTTKNEKIQDDPNCIGPSKVCEKVTSKNEIKLAPAGTDACAAWAGDQLRSKGANIYGDAWFWLSNLGGNAKYNAYKSDVNWNTIWENLKRSNISVYACGECNSLGSDKKDKCSTIASVISQAMPSSSSVNLSDLKVGDAVGMYHKGSESKSVAFCAKALRKGTSIDGQGYLRPNDEDKFTFNSHVGYVGAIKNGVPIIFHNVHGTIHATPATKLLSKNGTDMITWVASTGASTGTSINPPKNKKSWLDGISGVDREKMS